MEIQTHGRSIALNGGRIDLQRGHVLVPALRANILYRRTAPDDQIIHSASETARGFAERTEMFDHGDLRHFIRDQKQMRKDRGIFIDQPVKNFDRQLELQGASPINQTSATDSAPL